MPIQLFEDAAGSLMSKYGAGVAWRWGFDNVQNVGTAGANKNLYPASNPSDEFDGSPEHMIPSSVSSYHPMLRLAGPNSNGGEAITPNLLGDYLDCVDTAACDVGTAQDFTFSCWIVPNWTAGTGPYNEYIVFSKGRNTDEKGYYVILDEDWLSVFFWDLPTNGGGNNEYKHSFNQSTWYHVAIVNTIPSTGGTYGFGYVQSKFYVNGVWLGTDTAQATSANWNFTNSYSPNIFHTGLGTPAQPHSYGRHKIDDLWVIKKALTADEVKEIYQVMR